MSKYALEVMGPVTVSFCLYGILKLKGCHKKVQKEHWPYLMILGGLGYFAAIILQLAGTARLSGSLSSLMNSLNPVAISVMAAIFLKERITWKILGTGELQADLMGILFSAGSVILWSAASVSIRRISEYYDPVQTALYGMAIALILNVPAAVFENMFIFRSHPTEKALLACLFVAVVGTAVAHTFWNKSLQQLSASTCSMFYPLQPLVSAVLGVVLLHEIITWQFVAGAVLICSGIVINFLPFMPNKEKIAR